MDPSLQALAPEELDLLAARIEVEAARPLYHDVATALLDSLEVEAGEALASTLRCLGQLLTEIAKQGALREVAFVLSELKALEARGDLGAPTAEEVGRLLDDLSQEACVQPLVSALRESGGELAEDFRTVQERLCGAALAALLRELAAGQDPGLAALLQEAVTELGGRHPDALLALLATDEADVVAGAADALAAVRPAGLESHLAPLLDRAASSVRAAAVRNLARITSPAACEVLRGALKDRDQAIRIAAVEALGERRFAPAGGTLAEHVLDRRFRERDLAEKRAFLDAYAAVAGRDALGVLDGLLNGRGMFSRPEPPEVRACAAHALGRLPSAEARRALQRSALDKNPLVRYAVERALQGER